MGDRGPLDRFIGPPVEEWVVELLPNGSEEAQPPWPATTAPATTAKAGGTTPSSRRARDARRASPAGDFRSTSAPQSSSTLPCAFWTPSGWRALFTAIYGDKAEYASHSKVDLLARILSERSLSRDTAWMIGDRIFDIERGPRQPDCAASPPAGATARRGVGAGRRRGRGTGRRGSSFVPLELLSRCLPGDAQIPTEKSSIRSGFWPHPVWMFRGKRLILS